MKININKIFAIISVVLIVNVLISFMTTDERNVKIEEVAYSEFVTMIGDKNIKEVTFNKNDITYITQNNQEGVTKLQKLLATKIFLMNC